MRVLLSFVLVLCLAAPAAAQTSVVRKVRQAYPEELSATQKVLLLSDVARALGPAWGILTKPSGNRCALNGVSYSCDHVCRLDGSLHVDVLEDEEGKTGPPARPSWQENGPVPRGRACVGVPGNAPAPPSPPEPPTPDPDTAKALTDLKAGIELVLEGLGRLQALEQQQTDSIGRQEQALLEAIARAEQRLGEKAGTSTLDRVLAAVAAAACTGAAAK